VKSQSLFRFIFLFVLCGVVSIFASSGEQSSGNQHMQDRVSKEVYHELVMLPQLTIFDNIAFKVDGGKVTLLGQVRNAVLKDEAQGAIKKIEGVENVDNQIEILPSSPEDDRIRLKVARALFNDDGLFRYSMGSVPSIHIIVKMGHVTLEGAVNNQTDKDRAGLKANGVPGIFEVKNNLQIQQGFMRPKTLLTDHNG
jgi:hyperosmotically inducible periplasmic protein